VQPCRRDGRGNVLRGLINQAGLAARWLEGQLERDRRRRYLSGGLPITAAGLLIWIFILGSTLQGQAQVRDWSIAWVGLDLTETCGLAMTGLLVFRRHPATSPVAAVTATLFAVDAWFDVTTSLAGAAWYEALLFAFAAEIPLAMLLTGVSVAALRWRSGAPDAGDPAIYCPPAASAGGRHGGQP
jgi:hypothetical protein